MALESWGRDAVLAKIGVEPSEGPFNSIVLHEESNRPFNPLVNAGAIATVDLIPGITITERCGYRARIVPFGGCSWDAR